MSFFSVQSLSAGYGRENVIENICFDLPKGQLLGILGANGSGKSTLLKAVCGNLPHRGTVTVDGHSLETLSARQVAKLCSYIPQRSGIAIDISALEVVLMGFNPQLGLLEHPNTAMRAAAERALEQVGLAGKAEMNYMHLSEGQKQLCILARTLVADSPLLLLDEPESALDFRYRYRMLEILREWIKGGEKAAIVTLHDPALALNYCDRLLLLDKGKVLGTICPRTDTHEQMEQLLSAIYGPVSLQTCRLKNGKTQLVMLKEEEL